MKKIILFTTLILASMAQGETEVQWPDLSTIKYVAERPATESDINDGAAVFLLQSEGINIGVPISIAIPQYAIHTDGDTNQKSNVVIIQAEEANDQQVIGAFIVATNEYMAGLAHEFELLGQSRPEF